MMAAEDTTQSLAQAYNLTEVSLEDNILCFTTDRDSTYSVQLPHKFPNHSTSSKLTYFGPNGLTGTLPMECASLAVVVETVLRMFHSGGGGGSAPPSAMTRREESDEIFFEEPSDDGMTPQRSEYAGRLLHDVDRYTGKFGSQALRMHQVDGGVWVTISVPVDGVIKGSTATAWGIDRETPFEILLKFSTFYTEADRPPEVQIKQNNEFFPFGQHMCRILQSLLKERWSATQGFVPTATVAHAGAGSKTKTVEKTATTAANDDVKQQSTTNKKDHKEQKKLQKRIDKTTLALVAMGFDKSMARRAATVESNVDACVELLLAEDTPSTIEQLERAAEARDAIAAAAETAVVAPPVVQRLTDQYDAALDAVKQIPFSYDEGLLVYIADVLLARIPTSSAYCVLCDQPHVYGGASMIRSAVCARELCVFAFSDFKVGSDAASSIATSASVVELLLSFFCAAVQSSRATDVVDPFPSIVDPKERNKLLLDPKSKDIKLLTNIVSTSMKAFMSGTPNTTANSSNTYFQLRQDAEKMDPRGPLVMDWVVNSNRSYLVQITDKAKQLPEFAFADQYLLMMAAPEKQAIFDTWKAKKGTKFAFHGSRAENWHSILRNGLRSMSGTAMQLNGAAHGAGIYFAPQAAQSLSYCQSNNNSGGGWNVMALCEIINDECIKQHGWCWTVLEEEKVMTRMLFVFKNSGNLATADTSLKPFLDSIGNTLTANGL